jgi:hypothetical protein
VTPTRRPVGGISSFARAVAASAIAAGAVAGCSCGGEPDAPHVVPPTVPAAAAATARTYTFRWSGADADLPWNRTLWIWTEAKQKDGTPAPPLGAIYFEGGDNDIPIEGVPGTTWRAHSEQSPNRAIDRVLWTAQHAGTFGDETSIELALPPRAYLRLTGDESTDPGEDTLSVVDEEGGARLVAVRNHLQALRFAIWDASKPPGKEDWRVATAAAPPRPWTWNELRPGVPFTIAAKCEGKQWLVRRVVLRAGEPTVFDVAAQPAGGGTLICEDPAAELLLHGDLPIAPVRVVQDFYRASWTNVPPGRHAIRHPDGSVVPVDVTEGGEVVVPRVPRR